MLGLCVLLRGVCSSTHVDLALVVDRVDDDQNSDRCKDHCDGRSGDGEEMCIRDRPLSTPSGGSAEQVMEKVSSLMAKIM